MRAGRNIMAKIMLVGYLLFMIGGCALIENKTDNMEYIFSNDEIKIESRCRDFQLDIDFRKNGVNQLMAIDRIRLSGSKGISETQACTDWVGPYRVKDVTAKHADVAAAQFTGGWHGSNGNQTGQPTSRTIQYALTADDKIVGDHSKGYANKITLAVKNQIKSYNSGQFILEEEVSYTLQGNKIDVQVRITALKNAEIICYYGLQTQNNSWNNEIKYLYENGEPVISPLKGASVSAPRKERSDLNGFELTATNHPYLLHAWINRNNALTRFEFIDENQPCAFTADYEKSYFNLVNGKVLSVKKGQTIEWSGGYFFTSR
jgi:hypothetical protein